MGKKLQKQNFISGALIMMVAGLLVKIIGAIFKIPLGNMMPEEGMMYFTSAYDVYTFMYIIATAGLPAAISRMVATNNAHGRYRESEKVFRVTLLSFGLVGLVGALLMLFGANMFAGFVNNPLSRFGIMVIAPTILFEAIMSTYRGYYQGYQNMVPTAVSQLIVAILKLLIGYAAAIYLSSRGFAWHYVAAGAISGVTIGTVVGTIYVVLRKKKDKALRVLIQSDEEPAIQTGGEIARRLFGIAIPITIGSSVLSITNLLDQAVVTDRLLYSGYSQALMEKVYGAYAGYARTMFQFPSALIVSVGISLIPALAAKIAVKDRKSSLRLIDQTLRITMLCGMPAACGLAMLSWPILNLLFSGQPTAVDRAAPLLTLLGPSVVCVCLVSITNSILQAIGKQNVPVVTLLIGGVVKLAMNWFMVPQIGLNAAPISTNVCYGIVTVLNIFFIILYTRYKLNWWHVVIKPVIGGFACGGTGYLVYKLLAGAVGPKLGVLVAICAAGVVYLALVLILHMLTKDDMEMLPGGKFLMRAMSKLKYQF